MLAYTTYVVSRLASAQLIDIYKCQLIIEHRMLLWHVLTGPIGLVIIIKMPNILFIWHLITKPIRPAKLILFKLLWSVDLQQLIKLTNAARTAVLFIVTYISNT